MISKSPRDRHPDDVAFIEELWQLVRNMRMKNTTRFNSSLMIGQVRSVEKSPLEDETGEWRRSRLT